jgi:hypothetical protein
LQSGRFRQLPALTWLVPRLERAQAYWWRALLERLPEGSLAVFSATRFGGPPLVAAHAGSTTISVATAHIISIDDIDHTEFQNSLIVAV